MIDADPPGCLPILIRELANRVGLDPEQITQRPKLRDDYAFLNNLDCPAELKILAADKITAYHRYCQAHDRLFDCVTREEQKKTVSDLVKNYLENRAIIAEFVHYKEHGHALGKHPVFKWTRELKSLRSLNPVELVVKQQKLEHNIWRIETEIKANKKPHLLTEREQRLRFKKLQLAELNRMIGTFMK